jgi:hypothetical protein
MKTSQRFATAWKMIMMEGLERRSSLGGGRVDHRKEHKRSDPMRRIQTQLNSPTNGFWFR